MDAMVSMSWYTGHHRAPHRLIQGLQRRKAWGSRFHELFSRASQLLGSQGSQQDLNATFISSQQHHNSSQLGFVCNLSLQNNMFDDLDGHFGSFWHVEVSSSFGPTLDEQIWPLVQH